MRAASTEKSARRSASSEAPAGGRTSKRHTRGELGVATAAVAAAAAALAVAVPVAGAVAAISRERLCAALRFAAQAACG